MKLKPETVYSIRETLRNWGVKGIVKILLACAFVLWLFWPEGEEVQYKSPPNKRVAVQKPDPLPPEAKMSEEDLRKVLTAEQSGFYWTSFIWMMDNGQELTPKSFDNKVIFVTYLKDKSFQAENGLTCHPYSEKLIIAHKINQRRGIACRLKLDSWCRQPEGEKAICRLPDASFSAEADVTLHNLKTGWDRNLLEWGF